MFLDVAIIIRIFEIEKERKLLSKFVKIVSYNDYLFSFSLNNRFFPTGCDLLFVIYIRRIHGIKYINNILIIYIIQFSFARILTRSTFKVPRRIKTFIQSFDLREKKENKSSRSFLPVARKISYVDNEFPSFFAAQ